MLKALFRKQFMELTTFMFMDRKTGKLRSKGKIVLTIVGYVALMLYLAAMMFLMCRAFAALLYTGQAWLYYSLTGMAAIMLGVFGSVFNTYSGMYHSKDNELLLSMPIPPSKILAARLSGVAAMALMFEAVVFIPAIIVRFVYAPVTPTVVIFSLLIMLTALVIILVITCFLGWIIAVVAAKFKNRSFLTVIFALVFFALYYYFFSQSYNIIQNLITSSDEVGDALRTWVYPFYLMGMAGEGDAVSMLLFILIAAVLFALTWFILSRTFVSITTRKETVAKKVYREKTVKAASADKALLRKELKRFTSSANYMLNTALGSAFMVAGAVALLIFKNDLAPLALLLEESGYGDMKALIVAAIPMIVGAMNDISAPSVSLEGKNIWIVQSLPVPTDRVLEAKLRLHRLITLPPAILLAAASVYVLRPSAVDSVCAVLATVVFVYLTAAFGLVMNLKRPNLTWTNESIPVKTGFAPFVAIFGSWALVALFCIGGFLLRNKFASVIYVLIFAMLMLGATALLTRWVRRKGVQIFEEL